MQKPRHRILNSLPRSVSSDLETDNLVSESRDDYEERGGPVNKIYSVNCPGQTSGCPNTTESELEKPVHPD